MNYPILITFIFATASLAVLPGPDNIYVLMQSLINGKKSGMATVLGLITGCLVHTTLLAIGVSAIIKANETLFFGIKLLGALYLIYLAYMVFKSDDAIKLNSGKVPKKSPKQLFKQGFIMNVLNPKVTLFFLAFFPGFLFSDTLSSMVQFYILGFIFMGVSLIIFSSIALLAAKVSEILVQEKKIGLYFKWIQIVVFIGIAVYILFSPK